MIRVRSKVVGLMLAALTLAGCQQAPLGMTVGGQPCGLDLYVTPHSVEPGGHVAVLRDPGCHKDDPRQLAVLLSSRHTAGRPVGTARLRPDGSVTGTVVIPPGTPSGRYFLRLDEEQGCDDTSDCAGSPISAEVRVRDDTEPNG